MQLRSLVTLSILCGLWAFNTIAPAQPVNQESQKAIARAVEQLNDPDQRVRIAGVRVLQQQRALQSLMAALQTDYADVRSLAAHALGQIGDPAAIEPLASVLKDADADVRAEAVEALGEIKTEYDIGPLTLVLSDEDQRVRDTAIATLKKLGLSVDQMAALVNIPEWRRERGLALLYTDAARAMSELETYLQNRPDAQDARYILRLIEDLRLTDLSDLEQKLDRQSSKPKILYKPKPEWTEKARQMRIQGRIMLDAVFAADGTIRLVRIVRGLGHGLDQKVLESVHAIEFEPAMRNGQPINFKAAISVEFTLL